MIFSPEGLSKRAISKASSGFYEGFNLSVALGALASVVALIVWIILRPEGATTALATGKDLTLSVFRAWFVYAVGAFVVFCLGVVLLPASGRIRLGSDHDRPQFSTGAWLSMMFCSGIGAGVLIYAVSEPLSHFALNPSVIEGSVAAGSDANATIALAYTYLHWGLSAWACYAVLGLAIALFSYRYGMPLTIRTALGPLLGKSYGGLAGNCVDVFSIFAIIVGVATTLGYGVAQFVSGAHSATGLATFICQTGQPAVIWQLVALCMAGLIATGSVIAGGIKWLSILGAWLFALVLIGFGLMGDFSVNLGRLGDAVWTYLRDFPRSATMVAAPDHTRSGDILATWQTDWTIFYWAWWVAFAPFVALFLARVSRGRSLRAFLCGSMLAPVGVCAVWFAYVGGAALEVQLNPDAKVDLMQVPVSAQIYETIREIAPPALAPYWSGAIALLLILLLITTMNAAIQAINTIAAAGDERRRAPLHILAWGVVVTAMIGSLIAAGGTESIRNAMIIGAVPFSFVIALSGISAMLSILFECRHRKVPAVYRG